MSNSSWAKRMNGEIAEPVEEGTLIEMKARARGGERGRIAGMTWTERRWMERSIDDDS